MALEELSFESVNGRTHGQKVITIAHPEHSSGELKHTISFSSPEFAHSMKVLSALPSFTVTRSSAAQASCSPSIL